MIKTQVENLSSLYDIDSDFKLMTSVAPPPPKINLWNFILYAYTYTQQCATHTGNVRNYCQDEIKGQNKGKHLMKTLLTVLLR